MTTRGNRQRTIEHRQAIEAAILEAMAGLLQQRAFRDVSVEDVMSATGLSRTAFYRYFPDLEAVMLRLMDDTEGRLSIAAGKWILAEDPRAILVDVARELAEIYQSDGRIILAFADAAAGATDLEAAWREAIAGFIDVVAAKVSDLRAAGLSAVDDPVEISRALVWMTERYLLEVFGRQPGSVTTETAAKVLDTVWMRALFSS